MQVVIKLENNDWFKVVDANGTVSIKYHQLINARHSDYTVATFPLRFTKIGKAPIKVTAISYRAGDAILRYIDVKVTF